MDLANKYRPRKLADVVGQQVAVRVLTNAFKNKSLHHTYMFSGVFGTGKTTVARIMAASENCVKGPTLEPCGECKNCVEIFSGESVDVKEIDAASNNSVDDIRDLKSAIQYVPVYCRTRYLILDEAHSLSRQAAEAGLKMFEEPPKNVRFILCTTEPEAFKPTIRSRCQMIDFRKIEWIDLYNLLVKVAKAEGMSYEDPALKFAAKSAKGSARAALQNLETIANYCGSDKLSAEAAQMALGFVSEEHYFALVDAVIKSPKPDVPAAMKSINEMMAKGRKVDQVIEGLENHLRNLLIIRTCRNDIGYFGFNDEEVKRYEHQLTMIPKLAIVNKMLDMIVEIKQAVAVNLDAQHYLENFTIKSIMELVRLRKEDTKN